MRADLAAFLAGHHATRQPLTTPSPLLGGLSGAWLWRFETLSGPLVARAWPPEVSIERVLHVHAWLDQVRSLPFVPVPLADRLGRAASVRDGRVWELRPWMRGAADPNRLPAACAGLAAFHARLVHQRVEGLSPGLAQRAAELRTLLKGGFQAIARRVAATDDDLGRDWLKHASALAPGLLEAATKAARRSVPLQPCLRDARPDHFLFEGGELTGLIDFGAMGVECVAADLARLLGEWPGPRRSLRGAALTAYESVRPLGSDEMALIDLFERASGLLIGAHWLMADAARETARPRLELSLRILGRS